MGTAPTSRPGPRLPAVLGVAAVHVAVLSAACMLFDARRAPPPPAPASIPVVFTPPAAETLAPPEVLAAASLPVPTSEAPGTLAPLPLLTLPPHPKASMPRASIQKTRANRAPQPDTAAAAITTVRHPVSAAAPAPAMLSHDGPRILASWEARIRQAVQDAASYPQSARLLHREGSAQVRFDYDRGKIENTAIVQTSNVAALDSAAIAAVTRAVMPDPPAELGPQTRTMLVGVQFRLVAGQ